MEQWAGEEHAFLNAVGVPPAVFAPEAAAANAAWVRRSTAMIAEELAAVLLSADEIANRVGISLAGIESLIAQGGLAVVVYHGRRLFPSWQLCEEKLLSAPAALAAAFPSDFHPLDVHHVMTSPTGALDGLTPQRWLASGKPREQVMAVITELAYR